jgi:hypothetical protein
MVVFKSKAFDAIVTLAFSSLYDAGGSKVRKQIRLIEKYNRAVANGDTNRANFLALSLRIVYNYKVAR